MNNKNVVTSSSSNKGRHDNDTSKEQLNNMNQHNKQSVAEDFIPKTLFDNKNDIFNNKSFDENDFFEKLVYRLLNEAKKSDNFEGWMKYSELFSLLYSRTVTKLENKLEHVEEDAAVLGQETREAESTYKTKLSQLSSVIETINDDFRYLEDSVNRVGNTTVQIGNRLEKIDQQKKRAKESKKLIKYFKEFNEFDVDEFRTEIIEKRRKKLRDLWTNPNRVHEAAIKLNKLNQFVQEIEKQPICKNGVANIQSFSQTLDQSLSNQFNKEIEKLDDPYHDRERTLNKMKEIADILHDFNGGRTCVSNYISIRFFRFQGVEMLDTNNYSQKNNNNTDNNTDNNNENNNNDNNNNDNNNIQSMDDLRSLLRRIVTTCIEEHRIVRRVFRTPDTVLQELLRRIVMEILRSAVSALLITPKPLLISSSSSRYNNNNNNGGGGDAMINYLETLDQIYIECHKFEEHLLEHDLPVKQRDLSAMLESVFQEEKNRYINYEIASLDYICSVEFKQFNEMINEETMNELSDRKKTKKKNNNNNQNNNKPRRSLRGRLMPLRSRYHPQDMFSSTYDDNDDDDDDNDDINNNIINDNESFDRFAVSINVALNLMHANRIALERCRRLSFKESLDKNLIEIYKVLAGYISHHLNQSLDAGLQKMQSIPRREAPPSMVYEVLRSENLILDKLQNHFDKHVRQNISSSMSVFVERVSSHQEVFKPLEGKVEEMLRLVLNTVVEHTAHILHVNAKKSYFKAKDTDFFSTEPSKSCSMAIEFIAEHISKINTCIFGNNRLSFLSALGERLCITVKEHIWSFQTTFNGAMRMSHDLQEWSATVKTYFADVPNVIRDFDNLCLMAKVLIVNMTSLDDLLAEMLETPGITYDDLAAFLKMRTDFKSLKKSLSFFTQKS